MKLDARPRSGSKEVLLPRHNSGRERNEDAGRRTHDDDMIDRVCLGLGTHLLREHLSAGAEEKGCSTCTLLSLPVLFCRFFSPVCHRQPWAHFFSPFFFFSLNERTAEHDTACGFHGIIASCFCFLLLGGCSSWAFRSYI